MAMASQEEDGGVKERSEKQDSHSMGNENLDREEYLTGWCREKKYVKKIREKKKGESITHKLGRRMREREQGETYFLPRQIEESTREDNENQKERKDLLPS